MEKKFKVKLNSTEKVEQILQEIYDDAMRHMFLIQTKINELENSTKLADEQLDMKVKYAKAMHDYITDKEKCIGRKLDVSRLMAEVIKQNGNVESVISDTRILGNLSNEFDKFRNAIDNKEISIEDDKPEIYITNKGY